MDLLHVTAGDFFLFFFLETMERLELGQERGDYSMSYVCAVTTVAPGCPHNTTVKPAHKVIDDLIG